MMINFKSYDFSELVPHSPPMVLVDKVIDCGTDWLKAEIRIKASDPFFNAQKAGVETWVAIEYMAQAIASFAGLEAKKQNRSVRLGFLLGTRKFEIFNPLLVVNQNYQITIKKLYMDDSGLGSFECAIKQGDNYFAKAKLNVFETDDKNTII